MWSSKHDISKQKGRIFNAILKRKLAYLPDLNLKSKKGKLESNFRRSSTWAQI